MLVPFILKDPFNLREYYFYWVLHLASVDVYSIRKIHENPQDPLQCFWWAWRIEGSLLVLQNAEYHSVFKLCYPGHFSGLSGFRNLFSRKRCQTLWSPIHVTLGTVFPIILLNSVATLKLACPFFAPFSQDGCQDFLISCSSWTSLWEPLSLRPTGQGETGFSLWALHPSKLLGTDSKHQETWLNI